MSAETRRWIVAGGGTGGHVTPALAVAERIAARGDSVLFLGTESGLEKRLVPEAGFELVTLPVTQVMGRSALGRVRALFGMVGATAVAVGRLRALRPDCVVSVGGYASVPAALAAVITRVPLALIEPNAIPGRANRAVARFARRVFVQFEEAASALGAQAQVRTTGIPLRTAFVDAFGSGAARREPATPVRLLVFGGSQGARQLNELMIEAAPGLDAGALEIFHQTGAADRDRVAAAYAETRLAAEVVAFEPDMPARYLWADLALCRSGALTVAELAMAGLPALLVPYPFAADDHQTANARALAAAGAAKVFDSRALDPAAVVAAIRELCAHPAELSQMGAAASKLARPDAADRIVEECAALFEGSSDGTASNGPGEG